MSIPDEGEKPATLDLTGVRVLVLAAGSGRRLGLGPKAHVRLLGDSLLGRVVHACKGAALGPVRVVGSAADPHIAEACRSLGVLLTLNTDPTRGMSSSVWLGLEALRFDDRTSAVLIFPVDLPLVQTATLRRLGHAVAGGADVWARPLFGGVSGHPIALGAALVLRVIAMGMALPLRDSLRALGARKVDVVCDDPGVTTDIDLPEHLEAARAALEGVRPGGRR
jgi:nicotine blue oxidoreductase